MVQEISSQVAAYLLEAKAVKLQPDTPFTWASGWKSPIYCDNRVTLSYPKIRSYITKVLAQKIKEHFPDVESIAGVATAGIPQGALVAAELDLPFIYVRSKAKSHGMTNQIEGEVVPGQKTVVLEDLISTGGSSLKAAEDLRAAGIVVEGMIAIFTYGFPVADENFQKANVNLVTLSDYNALIDYALSNDIIDSTQLDDLKKWRENPSEWGK